jgi:hypothetical protein
MAIGNPFGLERTVTVGVVSATAEGHGQAPLPAKLARATLDRLAGKPLTSTPSWSDGLGPLWDTEKLVRTHHELVLENLARRQ